MYTPRTPCPDAGQPAERRYGRAECRTAAIFVAIYWAVIILGALFLPR